MRSGLLTEHIDIKQSINDKSEYGSTEQSWRTIIKTRAKVTWTSGNKSIENDEIVSNYDIEFTIRIYHYDKINENMIIVWRGKKYRILSIFPDKGLQQLTIHTELINE